jgi:hypothetical protein
MCEIHRCERMGQINLVRAALPHIADKGSFTLISGVLTDEYMHGGTIGTTINPSARARNDHTLLTKSDPGPPARCTSDLPPVNAVLPAGKKRADRPRQNWGSWRFHRHTDVLPQGEYFTRQRRR